MAGAVTVEPPLGTRPSPSPVVVGPAIKVHALQGLAADDDKKVILDVVGLGLLGPLLRLL